MTEPTNEEIFGINLDLDACNDLMHTFVDKRLHNMERPLFKGKWFDYRFMHPVQATYLYAHHYRIEYKAAFAKNIDTSDAEWVKPLKHEDMFECKKEVITGLWRGRQFADALGMPYETYLSRAFVWRLNYWQRSHLPRPSQLYADYVADRVALDWDDYQTANLRYSTLPQYRNENYRDLPVQNEHHDWIFRQLDLRTSKFELCADLTYRQKLLPEEKVIARYGHEAAENLRSYLH